MRKTASFVFVGGSVVAVGMFRSLMMTLFLAVPATATEPKISRTFETAFAEFLGSPEAQATRAQMRSVELDFASRDLVLAAQLELDAKRTNEHRLSVSPISKAQSTAVTAFLTKPFASGTTLKLVPSFERASYLTLDPRERSSFDWQISLSQDLWQDFFGRSTRLRRSRESNERRQQLAASMQSLAQTQVDFESLYWDWAMSLREHEVRSKNVGRGEEILRWTRDRFRRSAAESSDVLQAEALLTNRKLQLTAVEQNLRLLASRLQRYVPQARWQPDPDELARGRDLQSLVAKWPFDDLAETQKLELISVQQAALALEGRALESREQIRPGLSLQAAYGKNGLDPNSDSALRQAFNETHEYSSVGVVFTTALDLDLERKKVEAARAARDAARFRLQALQSDAQVAWPQLQQTVSDLSERLMQARDLTSVQWKKADAERKRYRLGRTTALQVITFEQDAGEAEIAMWNLFALLRKTEAQARLYAR